jgi:integrase
VTRSWLSGELTRQFPHQVTLPTEDWRESVLQRMEKVIFPVLGRLPVREVTRERCDEVMRRLPIPKGKDELQAGTMRQYAGLLMRVLNLAELCGHIERSPLPRGWLPRGGARKRFPILLKNEDLKLLQAERVPLLRRLFYGILHREGMRREEAARLTWADIDLENGTISLDENKTDHARWWNLDAGCVEALKLWRAEQGDAGDADLVFSQQGVPLSMDHCAERLRADMVKAGIDRPDLYSSGGLKQPFNVHSFRRSMVTRNLAMGASEDFVRRRTGHTSSELLRYRQEAKELAQGGAAELHPLALAIPELTRLDGIGRSNHREGGGIGRRTSLRC